MLLNSAYLDKTDKDVKSKSKKIKKDFFINFYFTMRVSNVANLFIYQATKKS